MLSSRFVHRVLRRRAALFVVTLGCALPSLSQEAPPNELPAPPIFAARGVGALVVESTSRPLPFAVTAGGPLVAMAPIVSRFGGQIDVGALGQSYTLRLGDAATVLAPLAPTLTRGEEILTLSQAPVVVEGELLVPLDLLEQTYGSLLGIEFSWQAEGQRLIARRPPTRELPVSVDLVHLQGTSTLVFGFPDRPRYRIRQRDNGYDIELIGDRLVAPPPRPPFDDPLVRAIAVAPERIRIDLVAGSRGESYELREPFRLVFDLFQAGSAAAVTAPPLARRRSQELRTIVLDPGHGGTETGATGPGGTTEKELTLLIAQQLRGRLEEQLGVKVLLTRTSDVELGLDDRAALANQNQADLFVSIHLNSSRRGAAHGAETYFLSLQASDQRAASVALAENQVGDPLGVEPIDPDLQLILWDLAQSQHLAASQRLAAFIQEELNRQLELRDRGVKQAPFRVLMGAAMPAVLVELGFLSSADEEERLKQGSHRAGLADALVRAIGRFKAEREGAGAVAAPAATPEPEP